MTEDTDKAPRKGKSRRRRYLFGTLGILVLLVAALATGLPQRMLFQYCLAKALGADVRVRGLSLVPAVRIAELGLADPGQHQGADESAVSLRGVRLDWTLSTRRGLRFPALHVNALNVHLRMTADGRPANYAFLARLTEPSDKTAPDSSFNFFPYIPRAIGIDDIAVTVHSPEALLEIHGIALDIQASSLRKASARLYGTQVNGRLGSPSTGEETVIDNGTLDVEAEIKDRTLELTAGIHLADRLDLDADARLASLVGTTSANVRIDAWRFRGKEWAALVPVPLHLDDLEVSESNLQVIFTGSAIHSLQGDVHARGTSVQYGPPGHEWYDGNVELTAEFRDNRGLIEAVLNNGQRLSVLAEGNGFQGKASATLAGWSRADLEDALPKDWRPWLAEVPHLTRIAGRADLNWLTPTYDLDVSLDPVFQPGAGPSEQFSLALDGGGSTNPADGNVFRGQLVVALGEGSARLEVDADSRSVYTAELSLAAVDLARWLGPLEVRVPVSLPAGTLNGSATASASPALSATGEFDFVPENQPHPVKLSLNVEGNGEPTMLPLVVTGKLSMGDPTAPGFLDFNVTIPTADMPGHGSIALDRVDLPQLASLLHIEGLPEGTEALVSGNVDAQLASGAIEAALAVTAGPASLAGLAVPEEQPLSVRGTVFIDTGNGRIHSKTVALGLTDDAHLDVEDLDIQISPFGLSGRVAGKVDFDYVGPILGFPSIVGALTVDAPLRLNEGKLESNLRLEGDGFGYGTWAGPYGTPVVISGLAKYSLSDAHGTIEAVNGAWGEGSTFSSPSLAFGIDPLKIEGPIVLETDLAPLVDLRFLGTAEGSGSLSGTLGLGENTQTRLDYTLAANSFILSDALAALAGLSSTGSVSYADSLNGEAAVAAVDTAAFGAMLHEPKGTCTIENGVVKVRQAEAMLYGGRLTFDAEYNLLDSAAGGRVEAHVEDLDLDRFTKEYEPPSVRLTGIADGDALVTWNGEGLQELRVDLASDQDFSMNREMVENLLLQTLTSGIAGLKSFNKRIQKRTIGDAPQRPFESATASLSLEGERHENQRLVGPVVLKSETLDFSIDVAVDLRAIADALEVQQQAQLAEGDTISAQPVQWELPAEKPAGKANE